jgi:hypothetical protein
VVRPNLSCATLAALETWASQKRAIYVGRRDGEPIASVLGRIRDERVAAGEGEAHRRQRWPEVYTGDGLAVQLVVLTLPELPRLVLSFYYVLRHQCRVPIECQATDIGIKKRDYWTWLQIAETATDTGLQVMHDRTWQALSGMRQTASAIREVKPERQAIPAKKTSASTYRFRP